MISFILLFAGLIIGLLAVAAIPRLLNLLLKPGKVYPIYGFHYGVQRMITRFTNIRFFNNLMGDSSLIVHYLSWIGYHQPNLVQTGSNFGAEIKHDVPYMVTVGSGTMVSDGLSIITTEVSNTSFRVTPTTIGGINFFGNSIVYPPNAKAGENCLFGTKAMIPIDGPVREGIGLLGSPSFEIPRSVQRDAAFDELKTAEELATRLPAKNRHNGLTLALFLLLQWGYAFIALWIGSITLTWFEQVGAPIAAAGLMLIGMLMVAMAIAAERLAQLGHKLVPRFCSIYDPATSGTTSASGSSLVCSTSTRSTARRSSRSSGGCLGVRMGKRVFDDGCGIPEKTLVTVGDDANLNAGALIQCHSMEDGAFKLDGITIGSKVHDRRERVCALRRDDATTGRCWTPIRS